MGEWLRIAVWSFVSALKKLRTTWKAKEAWTIKKGIPKGTLSRFPRRAGVFSLHTSGTVTLNCKCDPETGKRRAGPISGIPLSAPSPVVFIRRPP